MNETELKTTAPARLTRTFTVTLFGETRNVTATAFLFAATKPETVTNYRAYGALLGCYRTGKQLHSTDLEFETDPTKVERLTKGPFFWKKGDGFAFRAWSFRQYGNFRSTIRPVSWSTLPAVNSDVQQLKPQ